MSPDEPLEPPKGPPPPSLSDREVASFLESRERTPDSNTTALIDALRQLEDYGIKPLDALMKGMGRFPLAGPSYWRDDFGDARSGPPPHPHGGNDIFAAFDTPVRSPANGVVRYEDAGLGGKAAYVTEPDGTWYYLAHLNGFAPDLASGAEVRIGQLIGFNGDSGNAKGGAPHVHFEIHPRGGASVNPKPILDRWVADALAAVPELLAPYRQVSNSRPLTAVGLVRHFDRGMLGGPSRKGTPSPAAGAAAAGGSPGPAPRVAPAPSPAKQASPPPRPAANDASAPAGASPPRNGPLPELPGYSPTRR